MDRASNTIEAPCATRSATQGADLRPRLLLEWIGAHVFLGGIVLACVYLLDPSEQSWGAEGVPALKYLPIFVALLGLPLLLLGRRFSAGPRPMVLLLLTLATLIVLGGSVYTVLLQGAPFSDSFMGRGLSMLTLFPAYLIASRPHARDTISSWLAGLGVLLSVAISFGLVAWQLCEFRFVDRPHIYHEEVFLPAAAALSIFVSHRLPPPLRWLIILTFLAAGVVSLKNTGFLATLIAAAGVAKLAWDAPARTSLGKAARNYALAVSAAFVLAAAGAAAASSPEALPAGTPELRLVTYPARLTTFAEHPVFGQLFAGSPFMDLGPRSVQSHSDLLDVLAFGGVLGLVVLIAPLAALLMAVPRQLSQCRRRRDAKEAFVVMLLPLLLIEASVNPIWHQPSIMLLFWVSAAFVMTGSGRSHASRRFRLR